MQKVRKFHTKKQRHLWIFQKDDVRYHEAIGNWNGYIPIQNLLGLNREVFNVLKHVHLELNLPSAKPRNQIF